jgi:hypothetical protein
MQHVSEKPVSKDILALNAAQILTSEYISDTGNASLQLPLIFSFKINIRTRIRFPRIFYSKLLGSTHPHWVTVNSPPRYPNNPK